MLSLAALLLAVPVPGGTSVKLFEDDAEASYLDIEAGSPGRPEKIVWITHDYKKPAKDGRKYTRDQWSVSCDRRTFSIFAVVEYNGSGKVLSATAIPLSQRNPMPIPSGGRMQRVYEIVCGGGGAAGED